MSSSTPVSVTVWAMFQLVLVKTRDGTDSAASSGLLDDREMMTSAVGLERSTIVKFAVPPASVVVKPEVGLTVIPTVSLSVFVALTLAAFSPLYFESALVAAPVVIE